MDSPKRLAFGLLALSALALTTGELAAQAAPQAPQAAPQCQLKFEQAEIVAGAPAKEMKFTLALPANIQLDPTSIRSVTPDDESGLQISLVEGKPLVFAVDATAAKAGSWEIRAFDRAEAKGDAQPALCAGVLKVK